MFTSVIFYFRFLVFLKLILVFFSFIMDEARYDLTSKRRECWIPILLQMAGDEDFMVTLGPSTSRMDKCLLLNILTPVANLFSIFRI